MTIIQATLWTLAFLAVLLLVTALNVIIWRRWLGVLAPWLNLLSLGTMGVLFFSYMAEITAITPNFAFSGFNDLLLALIAPCVMFALLDRGLDPFLERCFPHSERTYQQSLATLKQSPWASLIHVGFLGPIVEELLMRGFVLNGLLDQHSLFISLMISSALFALLHFNMVQTVSALIAGLILGLLYIYTDSVVPCIIAHCLYNLLSYIRSTPKTDLKTSRKDAS